MEVKHPNGLIPQTHNLVLSEAIRSSSSTQPVEEAPPKQVAMAMERLSEAARLISDIRMGGDRLLEALFAAANPHHANKPLELFRKEDSSMRQYLDDLRSIGRKLEESGVLSESMRLRSNSWGLHLPVVCPDGAVVAYAWKRQLAGQAGVSAVDRTRLALKAFGDQKRRFFPHLDEDKIMEPSPKRHCSPQEESLVANQEDELDELRTLEKVVERVKKEVPSVKIMVHERLSWLKRAATLSGADTDIVPENENDRSFSTFGQRIVGMRDNTSMDKISVIELLAPSVFRCIVSLHPAGSIDPDAVAFFSPDESDSHVHPRGSSRHHVFKQITEHASIALQRFLGTRNGTELYTILHWICCYEKLFSDACSKCGRLLAMDQKLSLLLPPVYRSYRYFSPMKVSTTSSTSKGRPEGYHIGCFHDI